MPLDRAFHLAGRAWTLRYGTVGQDRGTVGDYIDTLPSFPDYDHMKAYEAARQRPIPNLSRSKPAERYRNRQLPSV